jgi:hypothetical protein
MIPAPICRAGALAALHAVSRQILGIRQERSAATGITLTATLQ